MKELIKFQITLHGIFWDKKPSAKIYLDDSLKYSGFIDGLQTITFFHDLDFGNHQLKLIRGNKTNDQSISEDKDQKLQIVSVSIDDINIRNMIWHYSWYEPKYPQPWALLQQKKGVVLESKVVAETTLGHNGTWHFNFSSPFYQHIINWMNGEVDEP